MSPIQNELKALLDELDAIQAVHEEVGDTDVREQMFATIYRAFMRQEFRYEIPDKFGMFSPDGNLAVREALLKFVAAAKPRSIETPEARFGAFQDPAIQSSKGSTYDEYFGHAESLADLDGDGPLPRTAATVSATRHRPWWKFW